MEILKTAADVSVDDLEKEVEKTMKIFENLDPARLIYAALVLVIGIVLVNILGSLTGRIFKRSGRLDVSLQKFFVKLLKTVLYFIVFITCASQLGIPMTSLVTILASLGLAVSLALQGTLQNIAGGIFLLTSKPFSTGDVIETSDAMGKVELIGIIHTAIITPDNRKIYIPNGKLSGETITNYSIQPKRLLELSFSVPYGSDLAKAKSVIYNAILSDERAITDPEPFVRVWELSGSAISIITKTWCSAADFPELRSAIIEAAVTALAEAGVAVAYEQLIINN